MYVLWNIVHNCVYFAYFIILSGLLLWFVDKLLTVNCCLSVSISMYRYLFIIFERHYILFIIYATVWHNCNRYWYVYLLILLLYSHIKSLKPLPETHALTLYVVVAV